MVVFVCGIRISIFFNIRNMVPHDIRLSSQYCVKNDLKIFTSVFFDICSNFYNYLQSKVQTGSHYFCFSCLITSIVNQQLFQKKAAKLKTKLQ